MSSPRSATYPPRPSSTTTTTHPHRPSINRSKTTPFLLHLTYRVGSYHSLSDFPVPLPSSHQPHSHHTPSASTSQSTHTQIPPHLQIYTWPSCTLRELAHILTTALPHLLPEPVQGTRLSFRLVFPDTRQPLGGGYGGGGRGGGGGGRGEGRLDDEMRGRYTCREMGSCVVLAGGKSKTESNEDRRQRVNGHDGEDDNDDNDDNEARPEADDTTEPAKSELVLEGAGLAKTLQDARFVIGDFIDVAVFPPLSDGSTAPRNLNSTGGGRGSASFQNRGGPPAALSSGNGYYEGNSYNDRPRGGEFGGGRSGGRSGYASRGGDRGDREGRLGGEDHDMPRGEWRRGERLPDGSYGGRGGYRGARGDGGGGRGGGGGGYGRGGGGGTGGYGVRY